MGKVTHFEIPASDPEKIVDFFKKALDWKFNRFGDMEYWLTDNGDAKFPGINGAVIRRGGNTTTVVNTISVDDLDETMKKIVANGGMLVGKKTAIPTVGWFTYFKDPEGTMHGVLQPDKNVK